MIAARSLSLPHQLRCASSALPALGVLALSLSLQAEGAYRISTWLCVYRRVIRPKLCAAIGEVNYLSRKIQSPASSKRIRPNASKRAHRRASKSTWGVRVPLWTGYDAIEATYTEVEYPNEHIAPEQASQHGLKYASHCERATTRLKQHSPSSSIGVVVTRS